MDVIEAITRELDSWPAPRDTAEVTDRAIAMRLALRTQAMAPGYDLAASIQQLRQVMDLLRRRQAPAVPEKSPRFPVAPTCD